MLNTNIYPILVTWKTPVRGMVPIYLAVDVNNKRTATKSLKRKVKPSDWDSANKEVRAEVPNAAMINKLIKKETDRLEADLMRKELLGMAMTKASVRKVVKGLDTGADFYAFCRARLKDEKGNTDARYAKDTARAYDYEIKKLEQFRPMLAFSEMDTEYFRGYTNWMKNERGNKDSTSAKSFKFLRSMLNLAMDAKIYIASNPIDQVDRIRIQETIPEYLEWVDVEKLHKKIIGNPGLADGVRKVGYCFLLSCYSGLRFSDVVRSGHEQLSIGSGSCRRLVLHTTKTGEIVSIPFTAEIASVFDWIQEHPLTITNQKYNEYLKFLSGIAEVPRLHSHMGRHSFGMRCAELGMAIDDVQKLMGHTKREMTMRYFRIKSKRLDQAMEAWQIKKPA